MMSHDVVMKQHMVAAWKNFHLVQTKLEFFNATVIVVSIWFFMTEAYSVPFQRLAELKSKLMFGFF
jgi:hypothetical protein